MILIFKFSITPLLLLVEPLDDGVSIVESQLASLGKILDGGLLVASLRTGNASVVVSLGKVGVDADGDGIVIDGLGQLVAPCMQVATVVIHIGVVAVLTDGVAEVGLGRMEIGNALAIGEVELVELGLTDGTLPVGNGTLASTTHVLGKVGNSRLEIAQHGIMLLLSLSD